MDGGGGGGVMVTRIGLALDGGRYGGGRVFGVYLVVGVVVGGR